MKRKIIALFLALALTGCAASGGGSLTLAEAVYPQGDVTRTDGYDGGLNDYLSAALPELLSHTDGENLVCSPLNIYIALSMLAETTDGNTRQQLLDLLGSDTIEDQRTLAGQVWRNNYRDDKDNPVRMAASLWLSDEPKCRQETVETIADQYYASVFSGKMGSMEYDQMLRDWLNEQTAGLLENQSQNVRMNPDTILAIAATVYFKGGWHDEFDSSFNTKMTFHSPNADAEREFMRCVTNTYYWGDNWGATCKSFNNGYSMWFILPDEGISPEELIKDSTVLDFLSAEDKSSLLHRGMTVNLSVPKFDINSDIDLLSALESLGVTDALDPLKSDFTPLTELEEIYISKADHAARVKIDEEGCEAAAYTVIMTDETAAIEPPSDEIDLILDRPFIFTITGRDGLPLFAGIVNNP